MSQKNNLTFREMLIICSLSLNTLLSFYNNYIFTSRVNLLVSSVDERVTSIKRDIIYEVRESTQRSKDVYENIGHKLDNSAQETAIQAKKLVLDAKLAIADTMLHSSSKSGFDFGTSSTIFLYIVAGGVIIYIGYLSYCKYLFFKNLLFGSSFFSLPNLFPVENVDTDLNGPSDLGNSVIDSSVDTASSAVDSSDIANSVINSSENAACNVLIVGMLPLEPWVAPEGVDILDLTKLDAMKSDLLNSEELDELADLISDAFL